MVFLSIPNGKTLSIDVNPNAITVSAFEQLVHQRTDFPQPLLRYSLRMRNPSRVLADSKNSDSLMLSDLGVCRFTTLIIHVPLLGGMQGAAPPKPHLDFLHSKPPSQEVYNIIPIHDSLMEHPSLRYPEVRAAAAALKVVGDLPKPPFVDFTPRMDLMDWLGLIFGFQFDNVRNQRENLVLHLANSQMRLQPPPLHPDGLDPTVLRRFRKKLLRNYTNWCSYLGVRCHVTSPAHSRHQTNVVLNLRRELLYVALYLLIWGESANLRFMPECICYIFHHMAMELNKVLGGEFDDMTGMPYWPSFSGDCAYLKSVVMPIYRTVKTEVESSNNGTKPHSAWRNYDDINEYFWSKRALKSLKWPLDCTSNFFDTTPKSSRVGKTGFVEQRSFWNVFRSFDRLWILLLLYLQAAIIVATSKVFPWQDQDVEVALLTIFISWAGLRLLQSVLDASTQYSLVGRETFWLFVRLILKFVVAVTWTVLFSVFYARIWSQKNKDGLWSRAANDRIVVFLKVVFVYVIPEMLALVLFIVPCIRNWIEELNLGLVYFLTWWFYSKSFVGRGLREGLVDNVKYSIFWIVVLATKFIFSYFLQIKPLIPPTRALLNLKNAQYNWHEFFGSTHRIAVVMLWLPVILVYLMDLQIWYSIYSSLVGATIGLFSHLGEIRNIDQLRLRFQFFSSAMQFNLKPEEHLLGPKDTVLKKIRDAIHRLKLRYGIGQPFNKIESSQPEATWFALLWNEIILTFREEDLISDREVELLELPPNCWNIRVIRWPCFLLCNELLLALSQANELCDAPDRWLWSKICSSEYRRCAVMEAFDSIKFVILKIVKNGTEEESILNRLFREIDENVEIGKVTEVYKLTVLLRIHEKLISLLERLMDPEKKIFRIVNILQALYELSAWEFPRIRRSTMQLRQLGLAPVNMDADSELLFVNAINLPPLDDVVFYRQVRRVHTILTSRDPMHNVPKNLEARERLAFFSNSLFMNMPQAPSVEKMMAFSVLTPYYDEEVMYRQEMLRAENEDGISTLFYLQKIYEDEWVNFVERMRREGAENENDIWSKKVRDLRLWASYRGQTLSRTVRGMMYYYSALKKLAFLDSASEIDIRMGTQIAPEPHRSYYTSDGGDNTLQPTPAQEISRMASGISHLLKGSESGSAMMKFTYVVACQVYGQHKAKGDHRAEEILFLMKNHEALRIAYVDEVNLGMGNLEYYSVLVKYDQRLQREVEIYRIRLPGPLKLGEGKPENQNHAIIFTRGDAIQTIDMNQDNHFEEALKMRNLLESFKNHYGIRKPTILGVREKVFTGSVSSLAWFMSSQETSFVTLGQRVLANPLKVRMHYGHPDVFDRFWFVPRGGISKASRVINISEDIFAGFNCTLRGGNVTHHEYIQVGKGRDVGLNQISMFEAKVASGNGEQALSRDVYRLGHRLDFFRMLSFFYTTVGYYFNTMLIVFTVYAFLWGRLYLALSGVERIAKDRSSSNEALGAILNQQFVIQLGLFTALPMILENSLERGFLSAIWDFITMQLQLASFFYTFSLGTRSHYFGRTILHGGAKYRATGRGFVVEHKKFAENYRLYARTHFIKAIELAIILLVYAAYSPLAKSSLVYILMTISSWFLITSWIIAPFLFNPSGFDWLKTVNDFDDFMNWLWSRGGLFTKADQSWFTWWNEEQDHLKTTGVWGKLLEILLDLRFFFFQYSIVYHLRIADKNTSIGVYLVSWGCIIGIAAIYVTTIYAQKRYSVKEHIKYRFIQFLVIWLTVLVVVVMLQFTKLTVLDLLISLLAFIPTGWGLISIAQVLRPFLISTVVWDAVISVSRLYDLFFGLIVMAPVALLSWLPGFQNMQTRILFNDAFSRGLQISIILTGKKST